jgi:phosphatidylglycerophosphate synthase
METVEENIMKNSNEEISMKEASESLELLAGTKKKSIQSFRPPLWLNALISISIGVVSFAAPQTSGSSLWTFTAMVAAIVMFIGLGVWMLLLRERGVKQSVIPSHFKGKVLTFIQATISAVIIIGSIELFKLGYLWTPYVSAFLHFTLMSYILYNYPTGDWQ